MRQPRRWTMSAAAGLLTCLGCAGPGVTVEYRSGHVFSRADRAAIERIANQAAADVRRLLPDLPADLRLTVQAGSKVIPETGESAEVGLPSGVYWTVDATDPRGVHAIVTTQLRATLFHEFYHLVREVKVTPSTLRDRALNEGLATVFERDFARARVPWGEYPGDVEQWTQEFLALPPDASARHWMFQHPDGRRWIGFKVGTYLVDRASRASGRSPAQLIDALPERILEWARLADPDPAR